MGITSLDFGSAARSLGRAARLRGLIVPVFASPPSRPDLDRSIRRRNGSPVVAVRLKGRPRGAVLADMVEGIVVANHLADARADLARSALWLAADADAAEGPTAISPVGDGAAELRGGRATADASVRTDRTDRIHAAAQCGEPAAAAVLPRERAAA